MPMAGVRSIIDDTTGDESILDQPQHTSDAPHMLEPRSLKRLVDFLFLSPNQVMPSERAFAENLLLRNFDALPDKVLARLADRLASSQGTAPDLTLKLAKCGRDEFSTPILRNAELSDIDIAEIVQNGSIAECSIIATRNRLSSIVTGILIDKAETAIIRAVLLNPGARISGKTLADLISTAKSNPDIQSAFLVRSEVTAPVAMNLFWYVPAEVREYILLTYLCDQQSLGKILQDDAAWQEDQKTLRPARVGDEHIQSIAKLLIAADTKAAVALLADKAGIALLTAARILDDVSGEPFLVVAKAMGASRAGLNDALMRLINAQSCIITTADRLDPLRGLFDRMSRGQALVALQYWNLDQMAQSNLPLEEVE